MQAANLFLLLLILVLPMAGQEPHGSQAVVAKGRSLYERTCGACHGANAKGGRGSDLTSGAWKWGGSDDDLIRNITSGIPGTQMPAFPIPEEEARAIIAFLRSLADRVPDEPVTGDPQSGRRLFFGAGNCSGCHMIGGHGGRLGPDLSDIRDEKSVSELRKAILRPDETLRPRFETVEVEFPGSRVVRGVIKNEDTFSLQIMDSQERLRFILKEDAQRVSHLHTSLMPASKLEGASIEDLIAFLVKGPDSAEGVESPAAEWEPSADLNVSFERLQRAEAEPHNWLTYWGNYRGSHYSPLDEITTGNVGSLGVRWSFQFSGTTIQTSPIVVDGLMFVTGPLNDAAALDARTGRSIWRYRRKVPEDVHSYCTVMTNRGFAILGDRLYMGTLDTRLVALDAKTGNVIWDVEVDDYKKGYSITHAPLALDGKIIVGVTSGECGLNGFVDAYDAATGKRLWRLWTIPQKGDPARASWSGDSADFGGGPTWMTGTYDADTDTLYWTTGNPAPDYDGSVRLGDNLYTCSVLALDPNTGRLKWHFQFTPHDTHDWDANETPVLIDALFRGEPRKLLIQANRNGFYYVLDRLTGEFLLGKAFVRQTWAEGLDEKGRPIVIPGTDPTPEGNYVCPDAFGGTNWGAPAYDPQTGLFYISVREACAVYTSRTITPIAGQPYTGSGQQLDPEIDEKGSIVAMDPLTGDIRWKFDLKMGIGTIGVLGTAGGVLFASTKEGHLLALDARDGRPLWRYQTGGEIRCSPIAFAVDGRQHIAIASDSVLFTFALP